MAKLSSYATLTVFQDTDLIPVLLDAGGGTYSNRNVTSVVARRLLNSMRIAQTAHGLAVGALMRFNGTNWVAATADTAANAVTVGMVTSVIDVDTILVQFAGDVVGLSGLTAGSVHYLQDAGGLGTTAGTVSVQVLLATSTTAGVLWPQGV